MFVWHFWIIFLLPLHRLELRRALTRQLRARQNGEQSDGTFTLFKPPKLFENYFTLWTAPVAPKKPSSLLAARWISRPVMRKQFDNKYQFQIRPKMMPSWAQLLSDITNTMVAVRHNEHYGYIMKSSWLNKTTCMLQYEKVIEDIHFTGPQQRQWGPQDWRRSGRRCAMKFTLVIFHSDSSQSLCALSQLCFGASVKCPMPNVKCPMPNWRNTLPQRHERPSWLANFQFKN